MNPYFYSLWMLLDEWINEECRSWTTETWMSAYALSYHIEDEDNS